MYDEEPVLCDKCKSRMKAVSPPDQSPLILQCTACGNRLYAEVQIAPPGVPEAPHKTLPGPPETPTEWNLDPRPALPVTVGRPGEERTPIHFGCVLAGVILVLGAVAAAIWILSRWL
jgi:hypothetical protein